ncbi:uncharacterized protein LOC110423415 [Herrania umbratica]|uniref:Uncharacterized protein LOC110423415 n=1 Tax=Herrania umbratica TaxID=108875 RepID=A0A6J1B2B6_9ROSI|nr:uncharacterized protein LOC110423415 [Herrania umbratica]
MLRSQHIFSFWIVGYASTFLEPLDAFAAEVSARDEGKSDRGVQKTPTKERRGKGDTGAPKSDRSKTVFAIVCFSSSPEKISIKVVTEKKAQPLTMTSLGEGIKKQAGKEPKPQNLTSGSRKHGTPRHDPEEWSPTKKVLSLSSSRGIGKRSGRSRHISRGLR